MSPEDRLSLYIDALIEGRRPPQAEGDEEWELLLETVRRVRRLAPPAAPEPDFPQRLAAALSHQLGGRRAGARWGLRRMTVFLGAAAAVLVLCCASYGYGRWSVEGRWPWWTSPPAETARERSAVEPGAPARVAGGDGQERAAVRQEASQLAASSSGPAVGTGGRERAIKGGPEVPAAGDRVRAALAPTGPVAGRAGEEEGRRPTVGPDAGGGPARTPAAPVQGMPAADPGITLIFGPREYRAVEVVRAGALAATTLELVGEGRARGLPDGERVPVYRGPDAVAGEVYTPVGEFWIRWAPREPATGGVQTGNPDGGP